ncbi:YcnI family protein [Actinomadura latina]|uniref:YcnI family protein n=1 Tax=Actinomadura latina TaxID=163603 RepID=A0A846YS12_9ACTN|nr:YcnI family protein [Actinomadura latina]
MTALASAAFAHVTISPNTAEPGGYGAVTVRVPNEKPDADTTKVELFLPSDHPIASVLVQPTPGWKVETTVDRLEQPIKTGKGEVTEAVTKIVWSGGKIAPRQFQQFGVSLGPLPTDTPKLYFKALQTYTDESGKTDVVRWIDIPSGTEKPEHPAPSLSLVKQAAPATTPAAASTGTEDEGGSTASTVLGAAALLVALVALATGVFARRRPSR